MRVRPLTTALAAVTGLLGLAACGSTQTGGTGAAGEEATTPRAIAAVALDHLPPDPTFLRRADREGGVVAAEIRYGSDVDGDVVYVGVGESTEATPCDDDRNVGCETSDLDAGTLYLAWEDVEPEEDPGIVEVLLRRDDGQDVSVVYAGDDITADPRTLDLSVTVDQMTDVVTDQRLGLTTSQDVIDAGEALDDFDDAGRGRGADTE